MIIGIDPGIKGALVALENDCPFEWIMMPTMQIGKSNRVNAYALSAWLDNIMRWHPIEQAVLEFTSARPGQGVTSMFTFGHACGTVCGVLGALEIPVTLVTPQAWKKSAGIPSGSPKDASRTKAITTWPQWRDLDPIGKGQAFADAALIGRFGT